MTSRNINIEISVYEKLKKIKKEDESFSQLLGRLLGLSSGNLKESFGALRDEPLDYQEIKKSRIDRRVVL
jgi:predicted CopG family antitoxin